jgi:antitoxin component YwqK of YwqJK toxin-antitoxin module
MKKRNLDIRSLRMIFIIATLLFGAIVGKSMVAQTGTTNKAAMEKLADWAGQWKGEGWSMDETQQKSAFTVEENIQIKIGGNAILTEGIGKDKSSGKVGFESLGLIYFDNAVQKYQMKSMTAEGEMALTDAIVNDKGEFIWEFEIPNGKIRYTTLVEGNTWTEVGEYVMPNGQAFPILEMTLTRVKD